ncbi:MAG TPA: cytochrome P450 [Polyangia bacterium]|nr:cytochrome P450 [Polyangia bacterium]
MSAVWKRLWPRLEPRLEWLWGGALRLREDVLTFYRQCEQQSGFVRTHVWRLPLCVVTAPDLIEEVLVKNQRCFMKSGALRSTQLAFGQGLLTSDRELWRRQRRTIQPAFHAQRLRRYGEQMRAATGRMLDTFRDREVRNVHQDMTDLCFEVLAQSLFGEDMPEARQLVAATAEALHAFHHLYAQWIGAFGGLAFAGVRKISTALGRPDFVAEPTILPTPYARRFRAAVAALDRFVAELVARRRELGAGDDFLSMLLAGVDDAGAPLSDRQIRDEVVTMFLAGHETAAASLSWALYLLAQHPAVARRLGAEVAAGQGEALLEQVMREGLRLYPPAYRISRTAVKDCSIGGHRVAAGDEILIPQWAVHRSPRHFSEPDAFRPERWTPELTARLPKFAYFPFGGGPRTCIGSSFAELEGAVVLGAICERFDLAVPHGAEVAPYLGVTLQPRDNELHLELRRRAGVTDVRRAAPRPG